MKDTKIEWATHSFNPWIGCSKVHAGCTNCYAEAMAGRLGVMWGPDGTRRRTAESTWRQVERWNRQAGNVRLRPRVFASLCDPFEDWQGPIRNAERRKLWKHSPLTMQDIRKDFFALIDRTPNLDWLLLTKRPQNIRQMWPGQASRNVDWPGRHKRRANVWLLYSASDQATLEYGQPHLLACRDLVPLLGLSLEPLIGPVDLTATQGIDWVIVGGESGPNARPCNVEWIRSIVEQCKAAGVSVFVKQYSGPKAGLQGRIPDDLWRIKEFPNHGPSFLNTVLM